MQVTEAAVTEDQSWQAHDAEVWTSTSDHWQVGFLTSCICWQTPAIMLGHDSHQACAIVRRSLLSTLEQMTAHSKGGTCEPALQHPHSASARRTGLGCVAYRCRAARCLTIA